MADLRRQLAYAPAEVRRRQMEAAEALAAELDPADTYPADLVVFRITGYRPDLARTSETLAGALLLGDLATFVQEVSAALELTPDERAGGAMTVEAAADAMGVSVRTLQRYRRAGLAFHVIDFGEGPRVGLYASSLERFRARHPERVRSATAFTRLDEEERQRIVEDAAALRAEGVRSLSRAASVIAERHRRSRETIRLLLRRHDAVAERPIFGRRAVFDQRAHRLVERAWRLGVPLGRLARRTGRSEAAVHRVIVQRRRQRLDALELRWVDLPTFALPDVEQVILASDGVTGGLVRLRSGTDALALLEELAGLPPPQEAITDLRLAAYNLLKWRAASRLDAIGERVQAAAIDGVETDLRWAALLKETLVAQHLAALLERVRVLRGRPVVMLPHEELERTLLTMVRVTAAVVERADPSQGQRVARLAALDTEKALARDGVSDRPTRAAARHAPGSVRIADPFRALSSWQAFLDPPPRWRTDLDVLPEEARRALVLRHGLDGTAPRTITAIAAHLGWTTAHAAHVVQEAEGLLRWRRGA